MYSKLDISEIEYLSQIVRGNSIPTFVIDNKHVITHWNKACENITGLSARDMIGTRKQWISFYSSERPVMADHVVDNSPEEEIAQCYGEKYRKSSLIEGGYEVENFFPDLGDKGKWLFFTAAPLRDAEGNVIGAIETLQDISERKWAEEELNRYRNRLEDIVEHRTVELTKTNEKLKREIEDRKRAEEALRESEEKFSKAFHSSPSPFTITKLCDGECVEVNESFLRVTGYHRGEVIGQTLRGLGIWRGGAEGKRIASILRQRGKVYGIDTTFITKSGEVRSGLFSAEIFNLNGEQCVLAAINDFTERKQIEEELRSHRDRLEELVEERTAELKAVNKKLQQELAERQRMGEALRKAKDAADVANQAKSEFLARMSHEIRTPIHGVMGAINLVLDSEMGQEQRQYLNMARGSAESLLSVITDVLDFSKIEAGQMQLEEVDFDLRTTLEEAVQTMAVAAHNKCLEITCHLPSRVPTALVGGAGHLRQVLVNLIGNAVTFTDQGEVVVHVGVQTDRENEVELHFTVRDTGIGISEDKKDLIFDPFLQADSSETRRYGGTGLGLAISLQLVSLMKGCIWVVSSPGEGSTFHFTAKFLKQPCCGRGKANVTVPAELRGLPVLIVDDNASSRLALCELLSQWGFKVTEAKDGPEALQELERAKGTLWQYRMVLLDKTLPEMDGFVVAERIQLDPAIKNSLVMMLPSDKVRDDSPRCQKLGIQTYLVKPVRESDLFGAILKLMGGAEINREQERVIPSAIDGMQRSILVVEDNATSQLIAKKMLEKMGHVVHIADNGLEASQAVEELDLDLVLMDIEMPEMNGFEATRVIRKREADSGRHIPIIAITAYVGKEDRIRCLEAGMDAYLTKPVNPQKLYDVIKDLPRSEQGSGSVSPVDIDAALEVVGGDEEILKEAVWLFLEQDAPRQLKELRAGLQLKDVQRVKTAAHALKGAVLSFGDRAAGALALRLEEMGRKGDLTDSERAVEELEAEIERFTNFFLHRFDLEGVSSQVNGKVLVS